MTYDKAITQVSTSYQFQSYFDSALLHTAIQLQSPGDAIVASTKQFSQSKGYGIAVHPQADCPMAFRFRGGSADGATLIVCPGQVFYPGSFDTFEYGLPFGWLGGGSALFYILHHPEARVDFSGAGRAPIVCHRARFIIEGAFPGTVSRNWPRTFPWPAAAMGAGPAPQDGAPLIDFEPEIAIMRLRSSIANPATLTFQWHGVDDLDLTGANPPVLTLTDYTDTDISFPAVPAGSGGFPFVTMPPEIHRLGCSTGGLNIIDPTTALNGVYIDIVRYCRLG
jgi:hypothetical protein